MASRGKKRAKTAKGKAVRPRRKPARDPNVLTPQQALFVEEYLVDRNATQAAIRAKYSPKSAAAQASELLKVPKVAKAVAAGIAARTQRLEISGDRVLQELAKIAFVDLRKAVRWGKSPNGLGAYPVELVPSEELDDDTAAAVSEVALTETGVKIKLHDKRAALVDLGKHLGLFVDRVKIDNPEEIARGIAAAQKAIESGAAFPAPPSEAAA